MSKSFCTVRSDLPPLSTAILRTVPPQFLTWNTSQEQSLIKVVCFLISITSLGPCCFTCKSTLYERQNMVCKINFELIEPRLENVLFLIQKAMAFIFENLMNPKWHYSEEWKERLPWKIGLGNKTLMILGLILCSGLVFLFEISPPDERTAVHPSTVHSFSLCAQRFPSYMVDRLFWLVV